MLIVASRDGLDHPKSAASAEAHHDDVSRSVATPREAVNIAVVSVASFVPTICLSGRYSMRVSVAFGVALAIVAPLELLGLAPRLDANHPLRVALPAILGALAYSEMYASGSSWPRLSRGYVMALLTFALAGVDIAALFFHVLGGAWIVPGFTILVCTLIWAVALVPKGRLSWLQS